MTVEVSEPASSAQVKSGSYVTAWILLFIAVGANIAAFFFNWYDRPWFDELIHAYSFFAAALLVSLYLYGDALTGRRSHPALLVFTVLCVGLALGVFWEWGEWAYDHLSGPRSTIHGKWDTQMDLLMDGIGALLAGLLMLVLVRR